MKDKRNLIIFLTVFIDLVGFGIIIPLNPYLADAFGATPMQVGLLMGIYSLMQFIFAPLWGQLSDRVGRRPVILCSLFGAAVAHAAFGFAQSYFGLVLARAVAGIFGGNISAAMAYVADITSERERSKGMGMVGAAFGLGFTLGPFIGGLFAELGKLLGDAPPLGQSFPALIAGAICFANFLLALKMLPESRDFSQPQPERASRLIKMAKAFTTPVLGVLIVLVFVNTFAMAHIESSLFLYMRDRFQWSLTQSAFGFAYIGLVMVFTQGFLIRRWLPVWGERRMMMTGMLVSGMAFALMIYADQIWILALALTALALGTGMTNPAVNGSISLTSTSDAQGNNLGVSQGFSSLARILGPPSGGALYQHVGWTSPFAAAAVISGLALLLALSIRDRLPERARGG